MSWSTFWQVFLLIGWTALWVAALIKIHAEATTE